MIQKLEEANQMRERVISRILELSAQLGTLREEAADCSSELEMSSMQFAEAELENETL